MRITLPELPPKQLAVFTDSQVAALDAAVHPQHRALLLVALGTGLRQGELLGLTPVAASGVRHGVNVRKPGARRGCLLLVGGEH